MSLTIDVNDEYMTLKTIKDQFSQKFSHLKLEFFKTKPLKGESTNKEYMYDEAFRIKDIRKKAAMTPLCNHGRLKISTLEKLFEEKLGIFVQVYKMSSNVWIQTTTTDDWTLSEQESDMFGEAGE